MEKQQWQQAVEWLVASKAGETRLCKCSNHAPLITASPKAERETVCTTALVLGSNCLGSDQFGCNNSRSS